MVKDILYINDTQFDHAPSSSWYNHPKNFIWDRNISQDSDIVVITHLQNINNYTNKKVYGWIIEPPEINNNQYMFAKNNFNSFEKIFTYDKNLLELSDKFVLLPMGGCWIDEDDRKIYKKNKLLCSINSNKTITSGHKFRHTIMSNISKVDLYGNGYTPIQKKIEVLKDYMFSIVIENQKMDYNFTEKIIDCFMTGTIPIYCGCPSIGNFFNIDGIITFNSIEDIKYIIPTLNKEFYDSKIEIIKENFNLSKKYSIADNLIYNIIKNG